MEQNKNNDRDEIFKDTENKNENEVEVSPAQLIQWFEFNSTKEFSLTDLNDGIQIPSREEIFGKVSELTAQYEEENEKFMKQMNDNKVKQIKPKLVWKWLKCLYYFAVEGWK